MRLGQSDEARQLLTLCYQNGYRNDATVNSLRLLDTLKDFATFTDATTVLKLSRKESELLYPYFHDVLTQAINDYQTKYRIRLDGPVQVEVYPDHEDFAVRTLGMPGLGALGVTFGQVVAMDSPSGRKPGEFHWASTLRHEMSHVFILKATRHRVPRWFTEGLAVHEETEASPEWGDSITPDIIVALRDHKLLPVAEMDRGFVHPEYETQVLVSYFEAGRMCDYIQIIGVSRSSWIWCSNSRFHAVLPRPSRPCWAWSRQPSMRSSRGGCIRTPQRWWRASMPGTSSSPHWWHLPAPSTMTRCWHMRTP